jgi:hypothetical protein
MQTPQSPSPLVLVGLVLMFSAGVPACRALPSHCDTAVPTNTSTPIGYQERGDRCEGKYTGRNVAAADVVVVAFDASRQNVLPNTTTVIRLPTAAADAKLTALSLRRDVLYRMDRHVLHGERDFRWSTAIAASAGLRAGDLGLVLTTHRHIAGRDEIVYSPVQTMQDVETNGIRLRTARLRLGTDFDTLEWRISKYSIGDRSIEKTSDWTGFRVTLRRGLLVPVEMSLEPGRCYLLEVSGIAEGHAAGAEFYLCESAR